MELLLNVAWVFLALGALLIFWWRTRSRTSAGSNAVSHSLIALACVICLLFPVVSASDDLHPTQALVEDATKRVHISIASTHGLSNQPTLLPMLLVFAALWNVIVLERWHPRSLRACPIDPGRPPRAGRAPPFVTV
jgi:hypothetical protein